MSNAAFVFISYAREDRDRIAILARCLEEEGWDVWWDRNNIRAGQRISSVIDEALDTAACVVVAWSRHSKSSRWVLAEAHAADEDDKLIPIFLESVRPPVFFRGVHTEDLSQWRGDRKDSSFNRLTQAIERHLPQRGDNASALADAIRVEASKSQGDSTLGSTDEFRQLLERIFDSSTSPTKRARIGDRFATLGDSRPGVGLNDQGLPDIDWIKIPSGPFLSGEESETLELPSFYIARYPVTNRQYQAFIESGGYGDSRWWRGLAKRIKRPEDPRFPKPNRARETVSWYEAMAYCSWLSDQLGYEIRLPTELEWEKAARGTDGRAYPWGENYLAGYANVDEVYDGVGKTNLERTTAVGLFPHGASPYGVEDMAGNLWEWCLNEFDDMNRKDTDRDIDRAARGGSWDSTPDYARVTSRFWGRPLNRGRSAGFRVLCSSPIRR